MLAYSPTCQTLAVGLGNDLYTWSEALGAHPTHRALANDGGWITSVDFSSAQGERSILAIGRANGTLVLKSTYDALARFELEQSFGIACVSWRPTCTFRASQNPFNPGTLVSTEDLLVGDETGTLSYYVVEWPFGWEVTRDTWPGIMTLVAKITIHSQQICGLAWSPCGSFFASGGNDDMCCLFSAENILGRDSSSSGSISGAARRVDPWSPHSRVWSMAGENDIEAASRETLHRFLTDEGSEILPVPASSNSPRRLGPGSERHRWAHGAAVKAIAFCPWRPGLVATGGGSNDKCIHFFHTTSGAALATIAVSAQVTSLVWSTTRREIAATFGYAQPEHPYRIAIFSWPDCQQVAAIPWAQGLRALYAIPYPACPTDQRLARSSRTAQEGCLVVAASDNSVKFHEVWSSNRKSTVGGPGTLASSDILESLEGIEKEGEVIR